MPRDLNLAALLTDRRRSRGSEPLLTYYDLTTGERTELSGTTFGNWVDKTANLLLDADLEPGDPVRLPLVGSCPGHWVSLVWCAAVWQVGGVVALGDGAAAISVLGPDGIAEPPDTDLVLACSLHPFGLGFTPPLPAPLVDYGLDVRGFPDVFLGTPAADGPGWEDGGSTLTQAELIATAPGDPDVRLLVRPGAPLPTVQQALLRPLRGAGSTVVVVGPADTARLAQLAAQEHAAP